MLHIERKRVYMPLLAAAHEMMKTSAELCMEAREIEKSNDSVLRMPHHAKQHILTKRKLHEKEA